MRGPSAMRRMPWFRHAPTYSVAGSLFQRNVRRNPAAGCGGEAGAAAPPAARCVAPAAARGAAQRVAVASRAAGDASRNPPGSSRLVRGMGMGCGAGRWGADVYLLHQQVWYRRNRVAQNFTLVSQPSGLTLPRNHSCPLPLTFM